MLHFGKQIQECVVPESIHTPSREGHWKFLGGAGGGGGGGWVWKAKL